MAILRGMALPKAVSVAFLFTALWLCFAGVAVRAADKDRFLDLNLAFHGRFLDRCENPRMSALIASFKQRLYDWPRRQTFLQDWEARSLQEHARLLDLLEEGAFEAAAAHHRDVHWSFEVQEPFIRTYYQLERED